MVRPEIQAVTPLSISKTRLFPPPLMVTPAAGPVIVCVPPVSLSSSWLPESVIVWDVLNTSRIEDDRVRLVIGVGLVDAVPQVARVAGTAPHIPQAVDGEGGQHDAALEHLQDRATAEAR